MTQPTFEALNIQARREKVRKRVRDVSVKQYQDGRERFTGRKANVLRWLAGYYNRRNEWPTSAELAVHVEPAVGAWDYTAGLLYVRRGLSDLQAAGVVEANGARECRQSGRVCETWRVVEAGR